MRAIGSPAARLRSRETATRKETMGRASPSPGTPFPVLTGPMTNGSFPRSRSAHCSHLESAPCPSCSAAQVRCLGRQPFTPRFAETRPFPGSCGTLKFFFRQPWGTRFPVGENWGAAPCDEPSIENTGCGKPLCRSAIRWTKSAIDLARRRNYESNVQRKTATARSLRRLIFHLSILGGPSWQQKNQSNGYGPCVSP